MTLPRIQALEKLGFQMGMPGTWERPFEASDYPQRSTDTVMFSKGTAKTANWVGPESTRKDITSDRPPFEYRNWKNWGLR
jgi:hypothetical protein